MVSALEYKLGVDICYQLCIDNCFSIFAEKRKSTGGDGDTKKESPVKKPKLDEVATEDSEKVAEAAA